MRTTGYLAGIIAAAAFALGVSAEQQAPADARRVGAASTVGVLAPTAHPLLTRDMSRLWYAPTRPLSNAGPQAALVKAFDMVEREDYSAALPALQQAGARGPLGDYALYYTGLAQFGLDRHADARRSFQTLLQREPVGYLAEAAAMGEADAAQALNDHAAAIAIYDRLSTTRTSAADGVLMRLGLAAKAVGDSQRAAGAFGRIYFDYPMSEFAASAGSEYEALAVSRLEPGSERYALELRRAERLFESRAYLPARAAFQKLRPIAAAGDRELVDLRIAECEFFLKRWRFARDGAKPYIGRASRRAEALFFYAAAVRELRATSEYLKTIQRVIAEYPNDPWAEEALNNLATHYIVQDDDDRADAIFRQMYQRFPKGEYGARAAWKIGWRAYRQGRFAETVEYFERAAADFPRSDYRPAWLYWAGRAHERLGAADRAGERYTLVTADYLNTYYGRLAAKRGKVHPPRIFGEGVPASPPLPNEPIVRALLSAGRYGDAANELRYAQRVWGDSPAVQATHAWISLQQGQGETGTRRFNLLRGSITTMRRAYPQFMAAGGEELPRELLSVIFPLSYWDLLRKHALANDLDPFLVAALVAQESTFVPDIRSHANAYGLMQLVPPTARRLARQLKMRYSVRLLTNPEANVRMGTLYLAQKIQEFGGLHLALASYNAGEAAVRRWVAERPGLRDPEEFIDDIPYPETQNYVKRLLGTAEDYRRLYGPTPTAP
jgi:soluble lytic murein transglycosylase